MSGSVVGLSPDVPVISRALLPRGLQRLIMLRYKAFLRRLFFGSVKRRLVTLFGLCIMALFALPQLFVSRPPFMSPDAVRTWLPLLIPFFTILQMFVRSRRDPMMFQPAEIDLVVPGPFSRRQLILYQIVYQVGPLMIMGLWFGLFFRAGGGYLSVAIGAPLFLFATNLLAGIVASTISIFNGISRVIVPTLLLLVGVAIYIGIRSAPPPPQSGDLKNWIDWAVSIRHTPIIEALCVPGRPFAETIASATLLEALPWALLAGLINVVLVAIFIKQDRGEVEALVTKSQEALAKVESARRQFAGLKNPERAARRQVPMLPRLGGAGPLLWRRWTIVYRGTGPGGIALAALATFAVTFAIGRSVPTEGYVAFMIAISVVCCLGLSLLARSDFRADLDHMAMLKTLPLSPKVIVLSQLTTPVLITVGVQCVAAIGMASGAADLRLAGIGLLLTLGTATVSFILVAIENAVFLIVPTRPLASSMQGGVDPAQLGRTMLITILKMLAIIGAGVIVGGPVYGAYYVGGVIPAAVVGVVGLGAMLTGLVFACVRAFVAFNVAEDQPA